MPGETLRLQTTTAHFMHWVFRHTQHWLGESWPVSEQDTLSLGHGLGVDWQGNGRAHWGCPAVIRHPLPDNPLAVEGWPIDNFVTFDAYPLADDRIEVTISWRQSAPMQPLMLDLLAAVAKAYPEARPQLAEVLGEPDGESEGDGGEALALPERPEAPSARSPLDTWFEYYHACAVAGFKCTLQDIAEQTGYSQGYVRQQHASWKEARDT